MSNPTDLEIVTALFAVQPITASELTIEVSKAKGFIDALSNLGYTLVKTDKMPVSSTFGDWLKKEEAKEVKVRSKAKKVDRTTRTHHHASPETDALKLRNLLEQRPRSLNELKTTLKRGDIALDRMISALRAEGTVVVETRARSNRGRHKYTRLFSLASPGVRTTPL